jgi:hypothetical protein
MASLVTGLLSAASVAAWAALSTRARAALSTRARAALSTRARRLPGSCAGAERYQASSGPDRRW